MELEIFHQASRICAMYDNTLDQPARDVPVPAADASGKATDRRASGGGEAPPSLTAAVLPRPNDTALVNVGPPGDEPPVEDDNGNDGPCEAAASPPLGLVILETEYQD